MAGRTDGLIKNFRAGAALARHRIVKFGASDIEALPGAAAADALIGVTVELDAAAGERVDVAMSDIADVRFGGVVARGGPITSDAQGRAIAAAAGNRIVGFALVSAVLDDIGPARIAPGYCAA